MILPAAASRQASVKALLYPLTPLESIFEQLIERLPRSWLKIDFQVQKGSLVEQLGPREFLSGSERPWLKIVVADSVWGGWYYLEAALTRNTGSREAFLGMTLKSGVSVEIPVPSNLRGSVREVFYVPSGAQDLTFMATAAKGFFTIAGLEIHRISSLEACLRQAHRVWIDFWGKGLQLSGVQSWGRMFREGGWLHKCYLESARVRMAGARRNNYPPYVSAQVQARRRRVKNAASPVCVSVVLPEGSAAFESFEQGFSSVLAQDHAVWEIICPALDALPDALCADSRIQVLKEYSLEAAWAHARGEWVLLLQPGMYLSPDCLAMMLECSGNPDCLLIYADEDRVDQDGQRFDPVFKPAWNPELHLSDDYIGDACLYRRQRLSVGDSLTGVPNFAYLEGAALRLTLLAGADSTHVCHVPQVLVHKKSGCKVSPELRAPLVQRLLGDRADVQASALSSGVHLRYRLPVTEPKVSVIIPTRDQVRLLRNCIDSLRTITNYQNLEIIVADNQSSDVDALSYMEGLQQTGQARVLECDFPFNFSRINNLAVERASGEVLVFLNNDTEVVAPEWLKEMVALALRDEVGAVGCRLLYGNGLIQHAGVIVGIGGAAGHWFRYLNDGNGGYQGRALLSQNLSAITGACLVMRRDVFWEVGGFDQAFAVAYNDVDLCLRLTEAGYRNVYTPHAVLLHHESVSRGRDDTPEKQSVFRREYALFRERWKSFMGKGDPAYSPNLSLDDESCSFAREFEFDWPKARELR